MIINIRNKSTWKGDGFYVGRPSPLSNPFKIHGDQTREICISHYGEMLRDEILNEVPIIITALKNIEFYLLEYGGCNLICYCSPKLCHAEIIKQVLLNKIHTGYWLVNEKIGVYGL